MTSLKPNIPHLIGLGATCIASAAIAPAPALATIGTAAKEIVGALAPGFAQQFLSAINYGRFKEFLVQTHPGHLNHDLDRLVKEALVRAVGYIKTLYLDQAYEKAELTLWQKQVANPFSSIKTVLEAMERDLTAMLAYKENTLKTVDLANYLLEQADDSFDQLTTYLFSVSGIDESEPEWSQLRSFFRERLPVMFDLAYKETLKDDTNTTAFKAFQIWLLEEGFRQDQQLLAGQQQIVSELQALKNGDITLKNDLLRQHLEQQTTDLKAWLINEFAQLQEKLDRIFNVIFKTYTVAVYLQKGQREIKDDLGKISAKIGISIPRYLTSNPFHTNYFIGRLVEIEAISDRLGQDNLLLLMNGEGGVGKTTLAARYYWKYQTYYKHMAWVLADGGIRSGLLANLSKPLQLTYGEQETEGERFKKLIGGMATLNKPALLVLDNANDTDDLKQTLFELGGSGFQVLITTRVNPFDDWEFLKVNTLSEEKALLLFCHHAHPRSGEVDENQLKKMFSGEEKQTLNAVLEGVGYNTLVITLLAKNFRERNHLLTRYRPADLLHDLQTKGLLKLPKTKRVSSEYGYRYGLTKAEPEVIIEAMYDLKPLPADELTILSNLAVLPPEKITYQQLLDLLDVADEERLSDQIINLYQKGWIDLYGAGESTTLKISPVVQAVVLTKNAERLLDDCEPLVINLITKFKTLNHTQVYPYVELTRYLINIIDTETKEVAHLCSIVADFYSDTGNLDESLSLIQKAVELYQKIGDQENYLVCLERLGAINQTLGKFEEALSYFKKGAILSEELYEGNPRSENIKSGLAISYGKIGEVNLTLGDFKEALSNFLMATILFEELCESNPHLESLKNGLAISYGKLGGINLTLGKFEEALSYFEKRSQLSEELYQNNPRSESMKSGLAFSYEKSGEINRTLGKFEEALGYFEKQSQLAKELYQNNPRSVNLCNSLAISYIKLGDVHRAKGDAEQAHVYFQQAEEIWDSLVQAVPQIVGYQNNLRWVRSQLASL